MQLEFHSVTRSIEFVRHPRARRYVLRVTRDGVIRVTVPRRGSMRQARAFAAKHQAWIDKQLSKPRVAPWPVDGTLWDRARHDLPPRVFELAQLQGLLVKRVSVRNQRTRWGSCSRRGNISLNWRLIDAPELVRDYIILHELMHLREMNHSERFWAQVEAVCPRWREAEVWLKAHRLA